MAELSKYNNTVIMKTLDTYIYLNLLNIRIFTTNVYLTTTLNYEGII